MLIFLFLIFNIFFNTLPLFCEDLPPPNKRLLKVLNQANSYIEKGEYATATKILKNYYKKYPDEKHYLLYLTVGNLYMLSEDYKEAKKYYLKGLEFAKVKDFYIALGKISYKQKNYEEAVKYFKEGIKKDYPPDKEIITLIALCYLNSSNYIAALEAFKEGLLFYPEDIVLREGAIETLMYLQKYEEALIICKDTVKLYPEKINLYLRMAHIYIQLNKYKEAVEILEYCLLLGQKNRAILLSLGDLYSALRMPEEAIAVYKLAAKIGDADFDDLFRIAYNCYLIGDFKEAISFIDEALKKKKAPKAYLLKAQIFYKQNNYYEAIKWLQEAAILAHLDTAILEEIFLHLGYCYLQLKKYKEAEGFFYRVKLSKEKDYKVKALKGLAEITYQRKDIEATLKYYQEALEYAPDDKFLLSMVELLKSKLSRND